MPLKFLLSLYLFLGATRPAEDLVSPCGGDLGDVRLEACSTSDPNDDDECFRIKFPFYFQFTGQGQSPSEFEVTYLKVKGEISGPGYGYVDENLSGIVATLPAGTDFYDYFIVDDNGKTFYWIVSCVGNTIRHDVPFGSCQDPLMEIYIVTQPGEEVIINTTVEALLLPIGVGTCGDTPCTISSSGPSATKETASGCSSELYLSLDGVPTGDPGDEVQLLLTLHNDGSSDITVSELDFRIKIEDVYGNLGGIYLDPNTGNNAPPAQYHKDGDEYYYLLNDLMPGNTISAYSYLPILNFSITAPEGLENFLGKANIEVLFARINIAGGDCCLLDVSKADGMVTFPGELPCEGDLEDVQIIIGPYLGGGLDNCQVAFAVYVNNIPNGKKVEKLLLEFDAVTEGSMVMKEVRPDEKLSCATFITCPGSDGCLECGTHTVLVDFDDALNPFDLGDGNGIIVVLDGLNGALTDVVFKRAALQIEEEEDACVPKIVFHQNLNLPLESGCDFCDNVNIGVGEHSNPQSLDLESCENGFSIYLRSSDSPPQLDEILIEFQIDNPMDLTLEVTSALCGTNLCPPSGSGGQSVGSCIYWYPGTGVVKYQYCPNGLTIAPGNTPLVDVKFSGMGCIPFPGVTFFETTQVHLAGGGYCSPVVTQLMNPLPLCNDCPVEEFTIAGNIRKETGEGVIVPVYPAGGDIENKKSAIYFVDGTAEEMNPCEVGSSYECIEITSTPICDGNYTYTFECSEDGFYVIPRKDIGVLNGVTTFDLVLIQKHILGTAYLDSPYKIIAADANKSNSVTTFDLTELRKLILFIKTEIENNTSWRFIDATFTFEHPTNPFLDLPFPECIFLDLSGENATMNVDFIAIKVGDVNNSTEPCDPAPFTGEEVPGDRSGGRVALTAAGSKSLQAGETATVDFWIKDPQDLVSWEMGLRFDTRFLHFEEAVPGDLEGMNVSCFGTTQAAGGKLRALWVAPYAQPVDFMEGYQAFSLRFKTLLPVENLTSLFALDDTVLPGRAYEPDGTANAFQLSFTESSPVSSTKAQAPAELTVAAVPNPFSGELRFFISVPQDDWLELSVFDVNGRLVASWSGETSGKEKTVLFDNTKNWGDGIFTYRVRTATQSATGKITKQ